MRGVYFFDEFDAIGSQRSLANDVGEIRRVLNSFLQMIEQDQSTSLIVAATNHREILDHALYRRFDDVIEYSLPTPQQAVVLMRSHLGDFASKPLPVKVISECAMGLSYAEIKRAVDEAIKEVVMHGTGRVKAEALRRALLERRRLHERMENHKLSVKHAGTDGR